MLNIAHSPVNPPDYYSQLGGINPYRIRPLDSKLNTPSAPVLVFAGVFSLLAPGPQIYPEVAVDVYILTLKYPLEGLSEIVQYNRRHAGGYGYDM